MSTQGSPIIKNLSVAILQLSEAGELAYLRSKWWASGCIAGTGKTSAAQPHGLKGMFLVLALGLVLGVLLAILELTVKSRSSASEQRVYSHAFMHPTAYILYTCKCRRPMCTCQGSYDHGIRGKVMEFKFYVFQAWKSNGK